MGKLFSSREARILMLGLDAAGKSTILFNLKLGEVVMTNPTVGFNVESVQFKRTKFNVWDIGGQDRLIPMWKHYFRNAEALIFVVDSSDRNRIEKAKRELHKVLNDEEMKDVPLLVYANKQDIGVMDLKETMGGLGLLQMKGRKWYCQATNGLTGQGLAEGMIWLDKNIK